MPYALALMGAKILGLRTLFFFWQERATNGSSFADLKKKRCQPEIVADSRI